MEHRTPGRFGRILASLYDRSVTLAKMAAGTAGEVLGYDASGNPVRLTVGTLGHPLLSAGAGAQSAFGQLPQAGLKTTTGEISTTGTTDVLVTGPGGEYGFWPTIKSSSAASLQHDVYVVGNALGPTAIGTSYLQRFHIRASAAVTIFAQQRYQQASPPYDLGDGQVPLFAFVLVELVSGRVLASWIAEDPPWAYNGPTRVRPDVQVDGIGYVLEPVLPHPRAEALADPVKWAENLAELRTGRRVAFPVDQSRKQADMGRIPQPFLGTNLIGKAVVLLDPVSNLAEDLARLARSGETVSELLHVDLLRFRNDPLPRAGPPGVVVVEPRWR